MLQWQQCLLVRLWLLILGLHDVMSLSLTSMKLSSVLLHELSATHNEVMKSVFGRYLMLYFLTHWQLDWVGITFKDYPRSSDITRSIHRTLLFSINVSVLTIAIYCILFQFRYSDLLAENCQILPRNAVQRGKNSVCPSVCHTVVTSFNAK